MATKAIRAEYRPVTIHPGIARVLGGFNREQLSSFIEVGIELLDAMDGDPDLEEDDPPGQCDEDGINTGCGQMGFEHLTGPGCVISDNDRGEAVPKR